MSDLHGNLPIYPSDWWGDLHECELLLICGDILPLNIQTNIPSSKKWLLEEFKPWAESLPVEQVMFIGGNHDFVCERSKQDVYDMFTRNDKVTYLHNDYYDYISNQDSKTYRIAGTPYCKIFGNWAFMLRNDNLRNKYNKLPDNIDVLISHDAPKIKEIGVIHQGFQTGVDAGNAVLADVILEKKPKYCFCGHIHSGDHNIVEYEGIKFSNTSVVNEYYDLVNSPLIIRL